MKKQIEKISPQLYRRTILFGKNRQISYYSTAKKNSKTEESGYRVDMIASIGEKAIIITVPNPMNPNHRMPYIVKRWEKRQKDMYDSSEVDIYYDQDGHRWIYRDDWVGRSLTYFDDHRSYRFDMNELY